MSKAKLKYKDLSFALQVNQSIFSLQLLLNWLHVNLNKIHLIKLFAHRYIAHSLMIIIVQYEPKYT